MSLLLASTDKDVHAQGQQVDQPNIIFILTDDLGWGDVGEFFQRERAKANDRGEPWMFTPHLDQMAAEGAQLTHHYCAAPVCAPSRASLLLGVSQGHANVRDNQFDKALEDNHTIASVLRQAGYATGAIGKWGLQGGPRYSTNWPAHPLNRGFDYFLGYIRHRDGHEHYPKEGIYRDKKEVWENRINIADDLDKCYTADLWTAAAKRWIFDHRQKNKDRPFFLYLAYDTPHAVLELPTQQYPDGGGLKGGIQWLGKSGQMINTATGKVDSWIHPDYAQATFDHDDARSTAEQPWPDVYKRYATSVRRIDSAVGDIIKLLRDLKIDSNTLVVFSSDNGPSLESYLSEDFSPDFFNGFGPFDGVKRDTWEGGVRMPTLAWWPKMIPGNRMVDTPSASYDWLPTFTEAAGIPAPARTDGVSLIASLTGKGTQEESMVYVEYFNNGSTPPIEEFNPDRRKRKRNQMQMIRVGDYAGVRYNIQSHADDFEIYDVVNDPSQATNLADQEKMKEMQQWMKDRVLQIRRPDLSAPRPYDSALVPPATDSLPVKKGLRWRGYSGKFPWIPTVRGLKPVASGISEGIDLTMMGKAQSGVMVFEGYIRVPDDGEYTFHLNTDAGALLRIHEALVIDADYGYEGESDRIAKMSMKAGLHPITLWYMMRPEGKPVLNVQWEGAGMTLRDIQRDVYHRE
jgi:arylsulfatase A-like enzyme